MIVGTPQWERKKELKKYKEYVQTLSIEEKGDLVVDLMINYEMTYKNLAAIFQTSVQEVIDYFKFIDKKKCSKCDQVKSFDVFHIANEKPDGHMQHCKDCAYKLRKDYYDNGPIEQRIKSRQWKDDNREQINFVENIRRKKPEVKEKAAKYMRERANSHPRFKMRMRISNLMYYHLNNHGTSKFDISWETLVGYNVDDLMKHLEAQFQEGMTWENYGPVWHVDHKVADALFEYTSFTDEAFKKCWSLENLQPMFAIENIKKGNSIGPEWNNVELAAKLLK
jgi:hypothetical protein